mgnify:CR=1 FL=1
MQSHKLVLCTLHDPLEIGWFAVAVRLCELMHARTHCSLPSTTVVIDRVLREEVAASGQQWLHSIGLDAQLENGTEMCVQVSQLSAKVQG